VAEHGIGRAGLSERLHRAIAKAGVKAAPAYITFARRAKHRLTGTIEKLLKNDLTLCRPQNSAGRLNNQYIPIFRRIL
jgi:hypothetical protein